MKIISAKTSLVSLCLTVFRPYTKIFPFKTKYSSLCGLLPRDVLLATAYWFIILPCTLRCSHRFCTVGLHRVLDQECPILLIINYKSKSGEVLPLCKIRSVLYCCCQRYYIYNTFAVARKSLLCNLKSSVLLG